MTTDQHRNRNCDHRYNLNSDQPRDLNCDIDVSIRSTWLSSLLRDHAQLSYVHVYAHELSRYIYIYTTSLGDHFDVIVGDTLAAHCGHFWKGFPPHSYPQIRGFIAYIRVMGIIERINESPWWRCLHGGCWCTLGCCCCVVVVVAPQGGRHSHPA